MDVVGQMFSNKTNLPMMMNTAYAEQVYELLNACIDVFSSAYGPEQQSSSLNFLTQIASSCSDADIQESAVVGSIFSNQVLPGTGIRLYIFVVVNQFQVDLLDSQRN